MILAPYDGFTKPSMVSLDTLAIWIQIHDLPDGYVPLLNSLAGKVGEVVFVEPKSHDFEGNFFQGESENQCKQTFEECRIAG